MRYRYQTWGKCHQCFSENPIQVFEGSKMHDSSLDRVASSENLTFYLTPLRAANENIKHRNVAFT